MFLCMHTRRHKVQRLTKYIWSPFHWLANFCHKNMTKISNHCFFSSRFIGHFTISLDSASCILCKMSSKVSIEPVILSILFWASFLFLIQLIAWKFYRKVSHVLGEGQVFTEITKKEQDVFVKYNTSPQPP